MTKTTASVFIGYSRVSTGTKGQDTALQDDALKAAGCVRAYTDHGVSGAKTSRPELDRCIDSLRPGETLVVWKLDRLGRNMAHLVATVNELGDRGVGFKSLIEGIDTTTAAGSFLLGLFASLASFETALLVERTCEGLKAARARGRVGGRRPVIDTVKGKLIKALYSGGEYTVAEIATQVGVSRASAYAYLKAEGLSNAAKQPL